MEKFGKVIVKLRIPILVLSILLLIPSAIGYVNTRVNYDILYYLPDEIETMQGQDILMKDFNKGAYAMVVVQDMDTKAANKLIKKVENVEHVAQVISYTGIVGEDVPSEMVPSKFRKYFENDGTDTTLFAIFFDNTTSSDDTMNAITQIRKETEGQAFISGMSAVVLVCIVLAIFMDSFLVPVFFMLSIGMAIVYNLGSNILLGEVSYITKALAAVLQLGVTLDYSIFLWHSYKEMKAQYPNDHKEAMAVAIGNTLTSVVGSSITTVAGFIALWEISAATGVINPFIFSSPSRILNTFIYMAKDGSIFMHIFVTLFETFLSFFLIIVLGLGTAIILWLWRGLSDCLEPYLIVLNSLPKSALAPMIIVWLGNNMKAIIITAISVAIFGMIINIYTGFLETDKEKIILIKTLGGTKKDILTKLILPGSNKIIISNTKVNIGLCLVGVIIGEFLAASHGLGYLIIYGSQVFKMTYVSMSIVILCIISTLLFKLVDVLEKTW